MEIHDLASTTDKMPILIGTWGFDVDAWSPAFYPEELPADWRFAYYSNWLRAVLLPAAMLAQAGPSQLADWVEDTDAEFRFVIELPEAAVDAALAGNMTPIDTCLARIAPLKAHTAGFLLPASSLCRATDTAAMRLLSRFDNVPLCVGGAQPADDCAARLARLAIGQCWETNETPAPLPRGRLLVVRTDAGTPAQQRSVLEAAAAWCRDHTQAAIFFDHPAKAQQARLLVELMNL